MINSNNSYILKNKQNKNNQKYAFAILHTKGFKPEIVYWFCNILAVKLGRIEELRGGSKSTNTLKDLKLNYFLHKQFWNWQYPVTSVGFGIAAFYKHLLF